MKNEPKALKEIHIIRERIYEETKNMTPLERAKYANAQAQLLISAYDLKLEYAEAALPPMSNEQWKMQGESR